MTDAEYALRREIVASCLVLERKGINQGTSGNVSVRWDGGILVTPSGLSYDTLAPEEVVYVEWDGTAHGPHNPSSEWRFHRDILRERPDLHAVVHAHPPYCTAHAIVGHDIPAVHYMIAAAGGPTIRCAPYHTFGTDELSQAAVEALRDRTACLLANHGLIACGPTLRRALWLAGEVETLARQYALSLQIGTPVVLPDAEIARVIEKFRTSYGPKEKR
jgi:L-fuculose-phosphate aldolase